MNNTENIKALVNHLQTPTTRINVTNGNVWVRTQGTGRDSVYECTTVRREIGKLLVEHLPHRKITRKRRRGGTYWKGFDLDCDKVPNITTSQWPVSVSQ